MKEKKEKNESRKNHNTHRLLLNDITTPPNGRLRSCCFLLVYHLDVFVVLCLDQPELPNLMRQSWQPR